MEDVLPGFAEMSSPGFAKGAPGSNLLSSAVPVSGRHCTVEVSLEEGSGGMRVTEGGDWSGREVCGREDDPSTFKP